MGLQPLEFSECLTDSPAFREKLQYHEKELERTSKGIKQLINETKEILAASASLSKAHRNFARTLADFQLECIGNEKTDDEQCIENSLKEFALLITTVEEERERFISNTHTSVIEPLERFRKEQIGDAKEHKRRFDKSTAKFCQSLERYLGLKQNKSTDSQLQEILRRTITRFDPETFMPVSVLLNQKADASLIMERQHFCGETMQYVLRLQEVQERKKFEFVEILLQFMLSLFTFYHQGHESSTDFKCNSQQLTQHLHRCRTNFDQTKDQASALMNKLLEVRGSKPLDYGTSSRLWTREGYLFLQEKKTLGTTAWTKHYCQYDREEKCLTLAPYNQVTGKSSAGASEKVQLITCIRRAQDSIDKRFCFDITVSERNQPLTLQAMSDEDRRLWLDAMDGKEPIYQESPMLRSNKPEFVCQLDEVGFSFVRKCIEAVEERGLEEEGLYRIVGVSSKVNKLTTLLLDKTKADKISLKNPEWEIKTITSALKTYFRSLREPLLTYKYSKELVQAAKKEKKELRLSSINELVHKIPAQNLQMLDQLINHLLKISRCSHKNLMTVPNLGVCFGPTILRPEEETMAAIMDIKFCNLVIEILIDNYDVIFKNASPIYDSASNTRSTPVTQRKRGLAPVPPAPSAGASPLTGKTPPHPANASPYMKHLMGISSNDYYGSRNESETSDYCYAPIAPEGRKPNEEFNGGNICGNSGYVNSVPAGFSQGVNPIRNQYQGSPNQNFQNNRVVKPQPYVAGSVANIQGGTPPNQNISGFRGPGGAGTPNQTSGERGGGMVKQIQAGFDQRPPGGDQGYGTGDRGLAGGHYRASPRNNNFVTNQQNPQIIYRKAPTPPSVALKPSPQVSGLNHAQDQSSDSNESLTFKSSSSSVSATTTTTERPKPFPPGRTVRTLYACEAENENELSFEADQTILNVYPSHEPGWLWGTLNGREGLIPENYVV